MTRRSFVQQVAELTGSLAVFCHGARAGSRSHRQQSHSPSISGITWIDSSLARAATDLARAAYPPYLFNHAMRTYLFGSLIGVVQSKKFDAEVLYVACALHDLGLTQRFEGNLPFEIQGAEAARVFLTAHHAPKRTIDLVWDGIALHPSRVADFKSPEVSLVAAGAGADVLGPDPGLIPKERVKEVVDAFPRLHFKTAFLSTCADVVRRYPGSATRSFMRDIGVRFVPGFHPSDFCDLVSQSRFSE